MQRPSFSLKIGLFIFLLGANIFIWQILLKEGLQGGLLKIVFFDVGEGDGILIDDGYGNQVLIDGGRKENQLLEKLVKELPFNDRKIELVILTHPDQDHFGALLGVLESYKVEVFLSTGLKKESRSFKSLLSLLELEKVSQIYSYQGKQVILGNGAVLTILWPKRPLLGKRTRDINNHSLILRLDFGKLSLLFTGDAERKEENELLKAGLNLKAVILKVGHHGSKTASSPSFLTAVSPLISIISVGKNNPYGHPHKEVLEGLSQTMIFRTDINGDIKILSDGKKMRILPEKHLELSADK